jgi:hypothetical protein
MESPQVCAVDLFGLKSGQERWVLITTDEHWDNAHCDRALLTRHHKLAVERNAVILKFGDLFCAMQGKWDKRADYKDIREEHKGNDYLNRLIDTAFKWYEPYAKNIGLISPGNHEMSILNRHGFDLTQMLVSRLKVGNPSMLPGPYWGYVIFKCHASHTADHGADGQMAMHWHHGYGGGGEVTRGMIDNNRTRGQYLADIYLSGHIHRRNMDENILTTVTQDGQLKRKVQLFLRAGTYKDETEGWHGAQGRASRPLGGWWLKFTMRQPHGECAYPVVEEQRAV